MTGKGRLGDFKLDGALQGDIHYTELGVHPFHVTIHAHPSRQTATVSLGPKTAPLARATLSMELPGHLEQNQKKMLSQLPMTGHLDITHFDLNLLSGFLPDSLYNLTGILSSAVSIGGTISQPQLSGTVALSDGGVTVVPLNQRIRGLSLKAAVTEHRLSANELTFRSGPGRGRGRLTLTRKEGGLSGQAEISLDKFPVVRPGLPKGMINGHLSIRAGLDDTGTDISLGIKKTHIHLLSTSGTTPPKEIRSANRVVYIWKHREKMSDGKDDTSATLPVSLSIDMTDPVEIRGQGVEMIWAGKVSVLSKAENNRVNGAIHAKPGRFRLLGNVFDIESGSVTFPPSGDLDPFVNIVATVRTKEASITATVRGRMTKPDLILSSDPAMSQYQIVALLLTGKSDTTAKSDEQVDVSAQAASLLLSFNNPGLERQLYEKIGVDRVAVSMGRSVAEPIVVVGKRIGRKVYVESEYHHNAPEDENRATGRIEYRLAPGWSLETEYGDAQKGEIGVYWENRFGGDEAEAEDQD